MEPIYKTLNLILGPALGDMKTFTCLLFPLSPMLLWGDRVCNSSFGRIMMWFTSLLMIKTAGQV